MKPLYLHQIKKYYGYDKLTLIRLFAQWVRMGHHALLILLLFGGKKIPELMKGLGKGVKSFKEGVNEAKEEINKTKEDIDEPVSKEK